MTYRQNIKLQEGFSSVHVLPLVTHGKKVTLYIHKSHMSHAYVHMQTQKLFLENSCFPIKKKKGKKYSLEYITRDLGYWFHLFSNFQSFSSDFIGITGKPGYKTSQAKKNEYLLRSPSETKSIK